MSDLPEQPAEPGGGHEGPGAKKPTGAAAWPAKRFRMSRAQRIGNAVVGALATWGLVPRTYVLTTRGRKTGRLHRTPVGTVEQGGKRWLVAPYGPVPWVLNARAAGRVTLGRRGKAFAFTVTELDPHEAGPVLKRYVRWASATRPFFAASKDSPVEDFVAEAHRHPVFALTRLASATSAGGTARR